jgi:hypothetical protein
MADTSKGYKYTRLQSPGTALLADTPVVIHSGIRAAILAGTVDLYDSTTLAGTAAGNLILSLGTATTMEAGAIKTNVFDLQTRNGLVCVATGTLDYYVTLG